MTSILLWTALVLLVTALAATVARGGEGSDVKRTPQTSQAAARQAPTQSRAELEKRLTTLASRQPPSRLAVAAMCYEMAAPPIRLEYVCPACGARTLYAAQEHDEKADAAARRVPWETLTDLIGEIRELRATAAAIKGLDVRLDESQFCSRCSPDSGEPRLVLVLRYAGEAEPRRVPGVTPSDLQLLSEFMSGSLKHAAGMGEEQPLRDYLPRLRELLGIEPKSAKESAPTP